MASTYVNDLRLNEMATGDASGTWGTTTNTNLELIGEALGYGTEGITTNADTHTSTIADGATDPVRAMYVKYTGTLDSACTITIAPNTINRMQFIENGTTGSQNIIISQGTGANITIPAGDTKAVYLDGAGSGAAVVDAFASINAVDLKVEDDLSLTSDSAVVTFGADGDTTLTHTDGTGLTLNSTNKICFNDASQFIQGSSATVLSLGATDEIDLTATAIDINGTLDVSGQATFSDGSAGAPSISNTGDANAGLYFSAADTLAFSAGGTGQFTMADGAISPVTDNDIDLGTASLKYKNFYAALVDGENFKVNGGQGSDGQVLTSTGSGVAWEAVSAGPTFKTFGTSSIMVGDDATGTIDAANYNTGLGVDIFAALTSGDGNTVLGFSAANDLTTGSENVAIGGYTLDAQTTASYNTAVGYNAGSANTSGSQNVFVGRYAGVANTTGANNVVVGSGAFSTATTGDDNTAIGKGALNANTTASSNTAVGKDALLANTTGTLNTAVGHSALAANTTANSNTAIGDIALTANTTGASNVAVGRNAFGANTTGNNNTAVGHGAGESNTTGAANAAFGYQALDANTTANGNTAIGYTSMSANTTGADNVGVGAAALLSSTTGDYNVAVGTAALDANTTADNNVAIGHNALGASTTAADNVAVGKDALAATNNTRNLGIGYRALTAQSGSSDNIAIGHDALVRQTTGANGNIAIGNYAGRAVVSSASTSQLVAIGHDVASNSSGALAGYQNVFVGYNIASASGLAGAFRNTALGAAALTDLTVGDNNTAIGNLAGNSITTATNNLCLGYQSGESGSPSGALTTGSNTVVLGNDSIGALYCTQSSISTSDERDKTDIENFDVGLSFINQMQPVTYKWDKRSWYLPKDEDGNVTDEDITKVTPDGSKKDDQTQVGFLAQDVEPLEKEIGFANNSKDMLFVNLTEDETRYGMQYERLVTVLVNAVKELSAKVEALENKE